METWEPRMFTWPATWRLARLHDPWVDFLSTPIHFSQTFVLKQSNNLRIRTKGTSLKWKRWWYICYLMLTKVQQNAGKLNGTLFRVLVPVQHLFHLNLRQSIVNQEYKKSCWSTRNLIGHVNCFTGEGFSTGSLPSPAKVAGRNEHHLLHRDRNKNVSWCNAMVNFFSDVIGLSDVVDLWVIKIKSPWSFAHVVCKSQVNRAQNAYHAVRTCERFVYPIVKMTGLYDYQTQQTHQWRNSRGAQRFVGFFPWLCFLGDDWLGRPILITRLWEEVVGGGKVREINLQMSSRPCFFGNKDNSVVLRFKGFTGGELWLHNFVSMH